MPWSFLEFGPRLVLKLSVICSQFFAYNLLISGECLQDHWSSVFFLVSYAMLVMQYFFKEES